MSEISSFKCEFLDETKTENTLSNKFSFSLIMRFQSLWSDTLATLDKLGFEKVWSAPLADDNVFIIAAHRTDGILLTTNSHSHWKGNKCTERTHLFFHWLAMPEIKHREKFIFASRGPDESGRFKVDGFDADDLDSLNERLEILRSSEGRFMNPWPQPEFIWLLSHENEKAITDLKQINKERLAQLPDWVREFVNFLDY
jgi:hypothetical protein